MAKIHGDLEDDFYYGITTKRNRGRITKIKYGGLLSLKNMDIIRKCKREDRLIDGGDLREINFASKSPTNLKRFKNIINFENIISDIYNNYVYLRFDISLMKECIKRGMTITREDLVDFIEYCRNTIRDTLAESILGGWCYGIENGLKENTHIHWNMFLDGNRYIHLTRHEANKLYEEDKNVLISTIYQYLDRQNNNMSYCNLNVVDLNDSWNKNKLTLVNKKDKLLRNCVIVMLSYICKKSNIVGKSYGKTIFKNHEMKDEYLLNWINSLGRLVSADDHKAMNLINPGITHHHNRLKVFFEFEREIASKYEKYLILPFTLKLDSDKFNFDNIGKFLKNYNTYRYNNKNLLNYEVGYCWSLNNIIDGETTFTFCAFLSVDDKKQNDSLIGAINRQIQRYIISTSDKLSFNDVLIDDITLNDAIYSYDYVSRNRARHFLISMSLLADENDIVKDNRHLRLYVTSKVRENTMAM